MAGAKILRAIIGAKSNATHSTRRPRTLSGRSTLGPYESFPDVLIRRGRRKDINVASESDVPITFYGRRDVKGRPENFHTGLKKVVLSTSRPNATYYRRTLPSGKLVNIAQKPTYCMIRRDELL